jgi:hypothetical protein
VAIGVRDSNIRAQSGDGATRGNDQAQLADAGPVLPCLQTEILDRPHGSRHPFNTSRGRLHLPARTVVPTNRQGRPGDWGGTTLQHRRPTDEISPKAGTTVNAILATLGVKLTERVAARLTGPGLLYISVCLWAVYAGHLRSLDAAQGALDGWTQATPLHVAVWVAVLLAAATLAGQTASLIGALFVAQVWVTRVAPPWWISRRQQRWDRAHRSRNPKPPDRYRPQQLTPIGDRFRLVAVRIDAQKTRLEPIAIKP